MGDEAFGELSQLDPEGDKLLDTAMQVQNPKGFDILLRVHADVLAG